MGLKEILEKMREKKRREKEFLKQAMAEDKIRTIIEQRKKSSNERELERFLREEREERIKERLQQFRIQRQHDINFNHNPLDVPNITNHSDFEILKQRNLFSGKSNMFNGQANILNNNPNLLRNGMRFI